MKETKTKLTAQLQSPFWKQVGFRGCFVVFAILFLLTNVGVFANIPAYERQPGIHSAESEHASLLIHRATDGKPFGPYSVLAECEVFDEVNPENEFDGDDFVAATLALPTESRFGHHTRKSLFVQLQLASERRKTISLIVLHHSWKSYLL